MGTRGRDIPFETQFLLIEAHNSSDIDAGGIYCGQDHSSIYTVFLPLLEGDFRAVLQGNEHDEIEICAESGKYNM